MTKYSALRIDLDATYVFDEAPTRATSFSASSRSGIGEAPNADASRYVGLVNTALTSSKEQNELLAERQRLLDLKWSGLATRRDIVRLEYVRWNLDRIDAALYGTFSELQKIALHYERFADSVEQLNESIEQQKKSRRR